jgi:nuclear GTP-binding protein
LYPSHGVERISKRINTRQRNRIQKKVSEHHRKARKLAKKSTQWKAKKPRDLGIPNSFPFKEEVLAEREEARRRLQEEKEQKRKGETNGTGNGAKVNVVEEELEGEEGFVAGIQLGDDDDEIMDGKFDSDEGDEEFDSEDDDDDDKEEEDTEDNEDEDDGLERSESSEWEGIESDTDDQITDVDSLTELNTMRNSAKPLYVKAINRADLVIFVLDAKAVELTRSPELEAYAEKKGKPSIFVLNNAGTPFLSYYCACLMSQSSFQLKYWNTPSIDSLTLPQHTPCSAHPPI